MVLTNREVQERLGVTQPRVSQLVSKGRLTPIRRDPLPPHRMYFESDEVDAYIALKPVHWRHRHRVEA